MTQLVQSCMWACPSAIQEVTMLSGQWIHSVVLCITLLHSHSFVSEKRTIFECLWSTAMGEAWLDKCQNLAWLHCLTMTLPYVHIAWAIGNLVKKNFSKQSDSFRKEPARSLQHPILLSKIQRKLSFVKLSFECVLDVMLHALECADLGMTWSDDIPDHVRFKFDHCCHHLNLDAEFDICDVRGACCALGMVWCLPSSLKTCSTATESHEKFRRWMTSFSICHRADCWANVFAHFGSLPKTNSNIVAPTNSHGLWALVALLALSECWLQPLHCGVIPLSWSALASYSVARVAALR